MSIPTGKVDPRYHLAGVINITELMIIVIVRMNMMVMVMRMKEVVIVIMKVELF